MKIPKLSPLNMCGMTHIVAPLMVMLLVAVGGTFFVVASHANPAHATGNIRINVYEPPNGCPFIDNVNAWSCPPKINKTAHVIVKGASPGATCLGINVHNGSDLGINRFLHCSPGTYTVTVAYPAAFNYTRNHKVVENAIRASRTVNVSINRTVSVNLGTYEKYKNVK